MLLWIALPAEGQFHFAPGFEAKNQTFTKIVKQFSALPQLKGASWGFAIKDPVTGKVLVRYNEKLNLIPASNMKVITSLNGMKNLGSDFQFQTTLWASGKIENGVLLGNLLIEGSGDPTIYSPDKEKFGFNFFEKLIPLLEKAGIRKIDGKLLEKKFFRPYAGLKNDWAWADVGNYYGAGIYALNINENQYHLYLSAPQAGKDARLRKKDSLAGVDVNEVDVRIDAAGTPDLAYIYWVPGQPKVDIKGALPQALDPQKVKGALMNPGEIFFRVLENELKKGGIKVGNEIYPNENFEKLGVVTNATMKKIVNEVNLNSNNLMTEAIGFALSTQNTKQDENGWTQLADFAAVFSCPPGYYFADACGLSLSNRISPEGICNALAWARKQPFYPEFLESLPTSGISGTMKKFCNSEKARGKIHAKSGTLSRVLCYSGYVDGKDKPFCFSIMINSYSGNFFAMKNELEKLMESMVTVQF